MTCSISTDAMITGLIQNSRESYNVNKPLLQGTAGKGEREDGLKEGIERRGDVADLFALPLSPFLILKASGKLRKPCLHMLRRHQNSISPKYVVSPDKGSYKSIYTSTSIPSFA